jgi:hypothetical protein
MRETLFSVLAGFENFHLLIPAECYVEKTAGVFNLKRACHQHPSGSILIEAMVPLSPSLSIAETWTLFIYLYIYQVNMIRHEAPSQYFDMTFPTPFYHQVDIGTIIVVAEKCLLPAVAALGDIGGCQVLLLVRFLP